MQILFSFLLFTSSIDLEPVAVGSGKERFVNSGVLQSLGRWRTFAKDPGSGRSFEGDRGSVGWDTSPPRELGEVFALVPGHRVVPGAALGRQESRRQLCQSCSPL